MDALRLSDRTRVAIKRIKRVPKGDEEIELLQFFSEEPRRSDPRNKCVPLLDLLDPGEEFDSRLAVMPALQRVNTPHTFGDVGEVLEFCGQMLQGLAFIGEHHVEHRDVCEANTMMFAEPLYVEGHHPIYRTRTTDRSPGCAKFLRCSDISIRYYFTDFGLGTRFDTVDHRYPWQSARGQDRTAPELHIVQPTNGFQLDVYCLGNMFREELLEKYPQLTPVLEGLVEAMTRPSPEDRLTAEEAETHFNVIRKSINIFQRSAPLRAIHGDYGLVERLFRYVSYYCGNFMRLFVKPGSRSEEYRQHAHVMYCLPPEAQAMGEVSDTSMRLGRAGDEHSLESQEKRLL